MYMYLLEIKMFFGHLLVQICKREEYSLTFKSLKPKTRIEVTDAVKKQAKKTKIPPITD